MQTDRASGACPLCRERGSETAHTGAFVLCGERVSQETRVCLRCGMTFEVADPDVDWASLYGSVWQRGTRPSARHRALYAHDARLIGPGEGRRVFDVGCGAGLLLDELARRGWSTGGCDPEEGAVRVAREKGHEVRAELFDSDGGLSAELVILGDVLEHQADPLAMLAHARRALAPDGRLYVRVPNLEAVNFDTFGDVFGLQHRVWFTADTLSEMLAVAGFRVESSGCFGRGLFAMAARCEARPWRLPASEPDRSLETIRRYSRDLAARREGIEHRLRRLTGRTVALYGAGEHAEELLGFSLLGRIASRVVDGNERLWGRTCGGLRIEAPAALRSDPPESVVIASKAYQDEIAAELGDLAARNVEILKLYAESG